MKVCFSVGQSSERVINSMSTSMDNIEFFTYNSVGEMIKESTMRHIFFDRIVFSEKILGNVDNDLLALNKYILEYSDNTTVVLICKDYSDGVCDTFSRIFNSPLYTPVISKEVSLRVLKDFVNTDIGTLKSKYYKDETGGLEGVTSKYSGDEVKKPVSDENKKGFLKGLFGSKRKDAEKVENQNRDGEGSESQRQGQNSVGNVGFGLPAGTFVPEGGNGAIVSGAGVVAEGISEAGGGFVDGGSVSGGSDNYGGEINGDEDLGLGDFGKSHADTGFLEDDEDEDIRSNIALANGGLGAASGVGIVEREINNIKDFEDAYLNGHDKVADTNIKGIMLIIGERGVGVSSYIADYSVELSNAGKKVLIIDLDYIKNGILSFIDTGKYLKGRFMRGISKCRPFYEDGIAVMSNGYGFDPSGEDILNLFNMPFNEYDVVLVDCPLDCIDLLNNCVLDRSDVVIRVAGNRGSIMSTIEGLTDRSKISGILEDRLFELSNILVVNKIDEYEEDLKFLRNELLFSRNNWLDKLD